MRNNFHDQERKEFRARLDYSLHPSRHIELPTQLYGRESSIQEMLDAFETSGTHPFIWGPRGIGKTSLGHTACEAFNNEVVLASTVACGKNTNFRELIDDVISNAVYRHSPIFKDSSLRASLKTFGIEVSTELAGIESNQQDVSINQAATLIDSTFSLSRYGEKTPIIIVDEFDRLDDEETFQSISDLLKQLSVISSRAKFCFCGVTDDLGHLLSAHESVDRYIFGVELQPLSHDSIWNLIRDTEQEFHIEFHRGQQIRIGQISAGYPHFAHLVLKNTLMEAFENKFSERDVTTDLFRSGLNRSATQAATRLRTAYENAVRKGTDRYTEVLFAVANSKHLNRQFKDIVDDYQMIMQSRSDREGYDTKKNNAQDLRNALNSLHRRGYLKKGKSGWYQFHDPMLRSYVRLIAETEGVELGDDTFPN
ncbi:ATP-binding protein [Roseovarius spongiae]|nr:ATP-binding protein [Roseovarius spongiae]